MTGRVGSSTHVVDPSSTYSCSHEFLKEFCTSQGAWRPKDITEHPYGTTSSTRVCFGARSAGQVSPSWPFQRFVTSTAPRTQHAARTQIPSCSGRLVRCCLQVHHRRNSWCGKKKKHCVTILEVWVVLNQRRQIRYHGWSFDVDSACLWDASVSKVSDCSPVAGELNLSSHRRENKKYLQYWWRCSNSVIRPKMITYFSVADLIFPNFWNP